MSTPSSENYQEPSRIDVQKSVSSIDREGTVAFLQLNSVQVSVCVDREHGLRDTRCKGIQVTAVSGLGGRQARDIGRSG